VCPSMDWHSVSVEELVDALREVEWSSAPRPLTEFFQRFTVPKNQSKWTSRLKCNVYYYRTNYFATLFLLLTLSFIRSPLNIVPSILFFLSVACLNDSFCIALNDRITRAVRRLYPPLAAKLRNPALGGRGRPLKTTVQLAGQDRRIIIVVLVTISGAWWYFASGLIWAGVMFLAGVILIALHASFRSPNLKARLNSFREEFRAVWRNYSDAP